MERFDEAAAANQPVPIQQQPETRQLEQQRQMHRAEPLPTPEEIAAEERRAYEAALRWVESYEPDRLC